MRPFAPNPSWLRAIALRPWKRCWTLRTYWKFLIAPGRGYLDGLAAADRGAKTVPPGFLPKIWVALTDVEGIPSVVGQSPCYPFEHHIATFGRRGRHSLLGRSVEPQADRPAYPVTLSQRIASPWEWQIARAFGIRRAGLSRRHEDPQEYRRLLEQAWKWQPADELKTKYGCDPSIRALKI